MHQLIAFWKMVSKVNNFPSLVGLYPSFITARHQRFLLDVLERILDKHALLEGITPPSLVPEDNDENQEGVLSNVIPLHRKKPS